MSRSNAKTKPPEAVTSEQIACEICLKEVPASEAHIAEAEDYIVHFCGLECYNQWKQLQQSGTADEDN